MCTNQEPFLFGEDFNSILLVDDKENGHMITVAEIMNFQECIGMWSVTCA